MTAHSRDFKVLCDKLEKDSDLSIIQNSTKFGCVACLILAQTFNKDLTFITDSRHKIYRHVLTHRDLGHCVPADLEHDLWLPSI